MPSFGVSIVKCWCYSICRRSWKHSTGWKCT